MSHTPGPWVTDPNRRYVWTQDDPEGYRDLIAEVNNNHDFDLIAAAPELLEALKDAVEMLDELKPTALFAAIKGYTCSKEISDAADRRYAHFRSTIAKAEGR